MADLTDIPWDAFPNDADPQDRVSANFKFYELTRSNTATRHGIDNSFPNEETLQAGVYVCRHILQRVRDAFGPYSPNRVFRSQALERALKKKPSDWVSRSQHTRGQACDIEVPSATNRALAEWVIDNLAFDQIILECYNPALGPNSGWVHVSVLPPGMGTNRAEILSYIMNEATRKYEYVNGLQDSL